MRSLSQRFLSYILISAFPNFSEDFFHTYFVGQKSELFVEFYSARITGPHIQCHIVAADFAGVTENVFIECFSHLFSSGSLIHTDIVYIESPVLPEQSGVFRLLNDAESVPCVSSQTKTGVCSFFRIV